LIHRANSTHFWTETIKKIINNPENYVDEALAGLVLAHLDTYRQLGSKGRVIVRHQPKEVGKVGVVSGERRFRAMTLLVAQGHFPKDVSVPVEVRDGLSAEDTLRIATIENVQRENLSPLEEADAIAALVQDGGKLEEIVSQTGLSVSTLRRRLALLNLSDTVRDALASAQITLAQAEAFTVGDHEEQDGLLEGVISGWYDSPDDIRDRLIGELPSVAMAIFPQEDHSGSLTTDLFGADDTIYFNDVEQFFALQKKAAEALVCEHDHSVDWAELVEGRFDRWAYREADDGESGGVVVCLTPEGKVEAHEGLIRKDIDASVSEALKAKSKATYARTVCEYIAMQKSAAVQAELIENSRKAKEIGVAKMLYHASCHGCLSYLADLDEDCPALDAIKSEVTALCGALGMDKDEASFSDLLHSAYSVERAYELVQPLSEGELLRLFAFLSAINFGQADSDKLDSREGSLFNRVATDLGVDMRTCWTPGVWFLSRRTMKQLGGIIREAGLSRLFGNGAGFKKTDLVRSLARYFTKVRTFDDPADDQKQARDWLPEAMTFPAVNPDAPKPVQDEPDVIPDDDSDEPLEEAV